MLRHPHGHRTGQRNAGRRRYLAAALIAALGACSEAGESPLETSIELPLVLSEANGGRTFDAEMTQETHATGYRGDLDGTGTARLRLNPGQGRVCWELAVENITLPATAAHIHVGAPGAAGPVFIGLSAPVDGHVAECKSGIDRDLLLAIIRDPDAYYVNVHNDEHKPGAVRSQLAH